jgi:hypothetical protein
MVSEVGVTSSLRDHIEEALDTAVGGIEVVEMIGLAEPPKPGTAPKTAWSGLDVMDDPKASLRLSAFSFETASEIPSIQDTPSPKSPKFRTVAPDPLSDEDDEEGYHSGNHNARASQATIKSLDKRPGVLKKSPTKSSIEVSANRQQSESRKHDPNYVQWIKSPSFDYLFGSVLMLNALAIGFETNSRAQADFDGDFEFKVINILFCVVFSIELLCRLFVYRAKLYIMKGWQWNCFDTFLVGTQVIDIIAAAAMEGGDLEKGRSKLGFLRLLRLARVLRLVRMVRLIPALKSMIYLMSASMWSFIWTMVLIILLMYCAAVFFTDTANSAANEMENQEDAVMIKKYWGSIAVSMLSLFKAVTGGDDWRNFIDVFEGHSSYVPNTLLFSMYVAFATLVMLNLVTGVFVEGAQRIVQQDKDQELMRLTCKVFGYLDDDNSMAVSKDEFMSHLHTGNLDFYFQAIDLNKQEAENLFALLDEDGSENLSVEEFVDGCLRLRGPARSIDMVALARDVQERFKATTEMTESLAAETRKLQDMVRQAL